MDVTDIISLLIGIALFLFGMTLMSEGLKKVAGNKLENILFRLTGNPIKGMLFGIGITTLVHSSSATAIMMIGVVNTNLMKVKQAVPVIIGSILGSCITGWMICLSVLEGAKGIVSLFSTTTLTGVSAVVGISLKMFSKKVYKNRIGEVLLGFSVLMVGLSTMSESASVLKESESFMNLLIKVSNPLLGILIGIVFTCIIQSATAAVGIIQTLTVTGSITIGNAVPLVMGISIGAAMPVLLSAIGSTKEGKQTALAYLTSNSLGVLIIAPVYYAIINILEWNPTTKIIGMVGVASINSIYRLVVMIVLLPLYKIIVRFSELLIPNKEEIMKEQVMILPDERVLSRPTLALSQAEKSVIDMAKKAIDNVNNSISLVENYSLAGTEEIVYIEELVDSYEDKLTTYLMKLHTVELDSEQNMIFSKCIHAITDIERISDHAVIISRIATLLHEKNMGMSMEAIRELNIIKKALDEILNLAIYSFEHNNLESARKIGPLEKVIDKLCDDAKLIHIDRLRKGMCKHEVAFVFNDILASYGRIAAHCSNIALLVMSTKDKNYETHAFSQYVFKDDIDYEKFYTGFKEKYEI